MSGLFSDPAFVPLAVLGASLVGSGHCLAMCGGLVASGARTQAELLRYHLGRLLGYVSLGALAGALGERVFRESRLGILPWIAALLVGGSLIISGLRLWRGRGMHLSLLPPAVMQKLYGRARGSAFSVGLLSAFLPCGWLHTFVLGALATQSAVLGAIFLFSFWCGTLPALTIAPLVFQKFLRPVALKLPRLSAALLVLAGVACIGAKLLPLVESPVDSSGHLEMTCHSSASSHR